MDLELVLLSIIIGLAILAAGLVWWVHRSRAKERARYVSPLPRFVARQNVRVSVVPRQRPKLADTLLDHTIAE